MQIMILINVQKLRANYNGKLFLFCNIVLVQSKNVIY